PRACASATLARNRWVLPVEGAPQSTRPRSIGSRANRRKAATTSAFAPAMKLSKLGGSSSPGSNPSCSAILLFVLIGGRLHLRRTHVPQPDEQRRRNRKREQHAREAEELAEGEQREDDRQRMKSDAIADEIRDQHVVLEQLPDAIDRQHGDETRPPVPLQ